MEGYVRNPSTYSFNAAAKTLTFSSPIPAHQGEILHVYNITRQTWIYLPQKTGCGGTWASPVLTMTFNTTSYANGDTLQVLYDDGSIAQGVAFSAETASGNITTQNLVPNGVATANSAVEIALVSNSVVSIQTTGTYTGALSVQLTNNGTRWETVTVAQIINAITGVGTASIASAAIGIFNFSTAGFLRMRVTGLAAMTGTATVTLRAVQNPAAVVAIQATAANLNATVSGTVTANIGTGSIAAGTNAIGDVGIQVRANATGAATVLPCQSPATPTVGTIKASAGRLLGYDLTNTAAALRYVKLFNATAPTLGTTAALIEIAIPAGATKTGALPAGMAFATAITHTVTSAKGLTNNTAAGLAAADVVGWFAFA